MKQVLMAITLCLACSCSHCTCCGVVRYIRKNLTIRQYQHADQWNLLLRLHAGGKFESSWLVHFGDMVFSSSGVVIVSLLGLTVVCSAAWWPFSEGEDDDVQTGTSRGSSTCIHVVPQARHLRDLLWTCYSVLVRVVTRPVSKSLT